jgi:putative acetyltransferase
MDLVIGIEDPLAADVRVLLETHLSFANRVTPPGHVHALDVAALLGPAVTVVGARRGGALLGVGALRELDPSHGELKSMHTVASMRGEGIGRAIAAHLVGLARERRYERVSLETGTYDAFAPARALYRQLGFEPCEPFGDYTANPHSICMTISLGRPVD